MNQPFSQEEIELLAQMKRFQEWYDADNDIRQALIDDKLSSEQKEWFQKIGVTLDLNDISFFWEYHDHVIRYTVTPSKSEDSELSEKQKEISSKYPLFVLWNKFINIHQNANIYWERMGKSSVHTDFEAWRIRRISSVKSELGLYGEQLSHPAFSFELNDGCSIGCWFCAFATEKLTGTLDYFKNRTEVLSIIRQCKGLFGNDIIQMALPYYRTEPHDNPNYIDFLKDYESVTGAVLCTSTAACYDIAWIRSLLNYYQREDAAYYWPRLSILSLGALKKIHTSFSPMELKDIELLIQVENHYRKKVTGGRILKENAGIRGVKDFSNRENLNDTVPQGTIACVSGFNINFYTRKIMLFSPCYTSNRWPFGFRVFGEVTYNNENDFPLAINKLINECIFSSPPEDRVLRFRDDIEYRPTDKGFDLVTPSQLYHFNGREQYGMMGEMIASGEYTYETILSLLTRSYNKNPLVLNIVIRQLFDDGFIDEVY